MFKIKPNPTFRAFVDIPVPGGEFEKIEFEFKHFTAKEFDDLLKQWAGKPDIEYMPKFIVGWFGVECEYSVEALEELFQWRATAPRAIYKKYVAEMFEAREKN